MAAIAIHNITKTIKTFGVLTLLVLCSSSLLAQTTDNFTATGAATFTVPTCVTSITVEVWGGGGAGGGGTNGILGIGATGGSGGGGGGYSKKVITVVSGTVYNIEVGTGGTGGGGNGTGGSQSWFGDATTVQANGGDGGQDDAGTPGSGGAASAFGDATPRAGGDGGEGDGALLFGGEGAGGGGGGGDAANGTTAADAPTVTGGAGGGIGGGTAAGGNGGAGHAGNGNGTAGTAPGGGGGAGGSNDTDGGNGARGQVSVTYVDAGGIYEAILASDNPAVVATTICATYTDQPIYEFTIAIDAGTGTRDLSQVDFTTTGDFDTGDIDNYQLWYNTSDNLGTATSINTIGSPGAATTAESFSGFTQTLNASATSYFWITTDVNATPTNAHTLTVSAMTTSDFTMAAGCKIGSASAGGQQTMSTAVVAATLDAAGSNIILNTDVLTLTGAGVGGSATGGTWSITSSSPAAGGSHTLSDATFTATPETVTFTPYGGYTGTVTLTLTSDGCGATTDTREIYVTETTTTISTPSTSTWTAPCGVSSVVVQTWGAGGGGGGGDDGLGDDGGGGAGGGGYSSATLAVTPGTAYTYTVGAGGTGGTGSSSPTDGTDGTISWFSLTGSAPGSVAQGVSANGGSGGRDGNAETGAAGPGATAGYGDGTPRTGGNGAAGGSSAGGGGGSSAGASGNGAGGSGTTGGDGDPVGGGDGGNSTASGNSSDVTTVGGGGGGGDENGYNGGDGGDGQIIITSPALTHPTANAGSDQTICEGVATGIGSAVDGTVAVTNNTSLTWATTDGTGTFTNATNISTATYEPSAYDASIGTIHIVLTSITTCDNIADIKTITVPGTKTWDGGGGDDNLSTAANWSTDVAPVADDILIFSGSTRTTPTNDYTAATDFSSIQFASGASAFTLSGNAIDVTGTCASTNAILASNTSNTMTITTNITMTATSTITSTSGGTLVISSTIANGGNNIEAVTGGTSTLSGVISGGGALTKSGSGALTLSATNTFTGGVTLSAGTLNIDDAQALGTSAGTFTIEGGTTIDAAGGAVDMSATDNPIAWNGDVTFTGTNNLDLGEGAVTMNASRQVTASANTLTIGGVIGDGASGYTLTKAGAGALTLSGTNTFTGGVTLSAGTLNIDNAQALGTSAGTFTIAGGTTIDASLGAVDMSATDNPIAWNGDFTFTGTNNLDLGEGAVTVGANRQVTSSANTLTIGGAIGGGAYAITKAGAGALTLSGTNTITGGVTLAAGTLNIGNTQALGTSAAIFIIADGTTINTSGGAIDMSATDNPMTWSGSFTFTGTNDLDLGDGTITMAASRTVTTSGSVLTVGGVLSSAANDLTSAGAGELAFDAQAVTLNDINITAGTLTSTSGILSLAGDFDNDATFTHNSGTVTFNGTTDQNLGTSAGTQTFYDVVINNTGASGSDDIILADPVTVTNTVTLTDGIINTDATNLLTLSNTATGAISGGSAGTFVNGPLSWDLTTGTTYTFPVGVGSSTWMRLGLSALTGSTNFTVEYSDADYGDATVTGSLNNASQTEYWDVSEVDPSVDADVTLYWENATTSDINSCAAAGDLVVAHFNGTQWEDLGNAGGVTGTCAGGDDGTVKATGVTSFSPFSFGSQSGGLNPLPIELLSFTTDYNGSSVDIEWVTASEINNDYFSIERSLDGINFEVVEDYISSKGVNGNSTSTLSYTTEDLNDEAGVYYYRLKQTDYDGKFEYSDVEVITIKGNAGFTFNIAPNPSNGTNVSLFISAEEYDEATIQIYDQLGQILYNQKIQLDADGNSNHPLVFSRQLSAGIYIITATFRDFTSSKRMVVQ